MNSRSLAILLFGISLNVFGQFGTKKVILNSDYGAPVSCYAADMDNDGDVDIISADRDEDRIAYYENLGDNNFKSEKIITSETIGPSSVFAIDLDGDGDNDILSSSYYDAKIAWYENLGGGIFSTENVISELATSAKFVYAVDLDGDLDPDVIAGCYGKITWYENLGDGDFSSENLIVSQPTLFEWVHPADLDADGDQDILATTYSGNEVVSVENLGDGTFATEESVTSLLLNPQSVYAADIDNDGDLDPVVASSGDNKITWYPNNGEGEFGGEIIISNTAEGANCVHACDLDNDGDMDVLRTGLDSWLTWFENLGEGEFGLEDSIYSTGGMRRVVTADIEGDGDLDIFSCALGGDGGEIAYSENNLDGIFERTAIITKRIYHPSDLYVEDITGDGFGDILVSTLFDHKISNFNYVGLGTFAPQNIIFQNAIQASSVFSIDMDGDGDNDFLTTSIYDDRIRYFENTGFGEFEAPLVIGWMNAVNHVFAKDLDGDGDPDVLAASWAENRVIWIENYGDGTFGDIQDISTTAIGVRQVHSADLDNDGDADVLAAVWDEDQIIWFENDGAGIFGPEQIITDEIIQATNVRSADLDNDGDFDIVAGPQSGNIYWFENEGDGVFSEKIDVSPTYHSTSSFELKDLDNDGLIDIVCSGTDFIVWSKNLGDGEFSDIQQIGPDANGTTKIFVADHDLDGDKDIFTLYNSQNELAWFENNTFAPHQGRGNLFIDMNENGLSDSGDYPMEFTRVISDPENSFAYSYPNGDYYLTFDPTIEDHYSIFPDGLEHWRITTDSLTYNFNVSGDFTYRDSLDFGLFPDTLFNTISAELTGSFPRCNSVVNYWLNFENQGTTLPSGQITLTLDDNLSYVGSEFEPDSIIGQNVFWNYDSLFYYEENIISLQVLMPDFMLIGDTLKSYLSVTIDSLDGPVFNAVDTLRQILVCAYDPNDKISEPAGIDSMGYLDPESEFLEYTIRFQNTGTDTAQNVIITDQLDVNLNWTTFTAVASSHPVTLDYNPFGELTFTFRDIMLPDSNVNEIASHGFVKYRIEIDEDLPIPTSIRNSANIYFDENPAVITNVKINTLFDCNSIFEEATLPSYECPNRFITAFIPDSITNTIYTWETDWLDPLVGNEFSWYADASGIFEITINVENEWCSKDTNISVVVYETIPDLELETVNICEGDSIMIFDNYRFETGSYSDSLLSIHGCDSVIHQNLTLLPVYISDYDDLYICNLDSTLIFGTYRSDEGIYQDTLMTISGCDSILSQTLFLHDLPTVTISDLDDDVICVDAGDVNLIGTPAMGDFSGVGITGSIFNPSIADIGVHTIYYQFEDDFGCQSTDSVLINVVDCLGIKEQNQRQVTIYPNPFENFTTINFGVELTENHNIIIYDILGQIVYRHENVLGSTIKIEDKNFVSGSYMLFLYDSNSEEIFNTKLMVE